MENKRGNVLTENLIFIILNIAFISIILIFVFTRMDNAATLEETYSKQIALMIDAAQPGTEIHLNMGDAFDRADKERYYNSAVSVENNVVNVKLSEGAGHDYSFFNNADVSVTEYREDKLVVIFIDPKE
jgi:hypothetical protein